jgi:hypothetical protein
MPAGQGLELLPLLERLDALLIDAVDVAGEMRGPAAADDPYRGIVIGRDEVEGLLRRRPGEPMFPPPGAERPEPRPAMSWLADTFGLTGFDLDVLVLAVAPELDLRYERLYAYLQDDVPRRRPAVDLALNLLCGSAPERITARRRFAPDAPLIRHRLVELIGPPHDSLLARAIRPDEQVLRFLLGESALDSRLAGCAELTAGPAAPAASPAAAAGPVQRRLHVRGPDGAGYAVAVALAEECGLPLLTVDLARASSGPAPVDEVIRVAFREAWFRRTALLLTGAHSGGALSREVTASRVPTVLTGAEPWLPGHSEDDGVVTVAAPAFAGSARELSLLARSVRHTFGWADLILPEDTIRQLREFAQRVHHRQQVLDEWQFGRLLPYGRGVTALFAGSSGTGKTMAAGVVAAELGLNLYEIDLATVVSKYIGETEKNLERIFTAAESANAVLFFDEADAIFGKRSQVHDAHDRYANLEIAYLLRRMEHYEGVAILATNLRENVDGAFLRRVQHVIEFPMPSEPDRERMWRGFFPAAAPVADELDLGFLARQFRLSGGNIKNIVLSAAYLASANGGRIGMPHLIQATVTEHRKIGRIFSPDDAGEYRATVPGGFG